MRPGGLTALAIFNFVFGGLSALLNLIGVATVEIQLEQLRQTAKITGDPVPSAAILYAMIGMSLVRAALLIASGVGYLGLRRLVGRTFGNAYAVLALIAIVLEATLLPHFFSIASLLDFVYPLITLFLLNLIFRKDFTR
jgi:hypothetical protein